MSEVIKRVIMFTYKDVAQWLKQHGTTVTITVTRCELNPNTILSFKLLDANRKQVTEVFHPKYRVIKAENDAVTHKLLTFVEWEDKFERRAGREQNRRDLNLDVSRMEDLYVQYVEANLRIA